MNSSIDSLQWRYAVKKFDATKLLSETKIDLLKEAFNLTATSYGLQPIKLVVVHNKELQENLVAHSYNQQQVAQASHLLVLCIETDISEAYIRNYFNLIKKIRNTSDEILMPFQDSLISSFSKMSGEEKKAWAIKQAYLALGNLLTVCALEKIDACPMEGFIPSKYDELLGIEDMNLTSVLVLPVGYRAVDDFFATLPKVRKPLATVIIER
ncbi:nitroreductase [Cellulophaga algicola DSM 14237]|uniref:Nitroreductase n=1 Tax=Cellulophaga algicola (strain DSM 14237 / IC166 / ACAM 630) TaxID=688270 RepID=E6X963_CELAD|nr:NAD(P)H-dependent oxidoreductase [Cellulophaga algicola]ADV50873.1 nitroreductase [Cellulophaga algicola DSM 14237]